MMGGTVDMEQKNDFLGRDPIGRLLWRMSLPAIVAQLINLLYNLVDRVYIGHMPEDGALALTGVGVCLPIIMIVSAFAALVSNGGAPRASMAMGKGDYDEAEKILGNSVALQIVISAVLTVLLLLFYRPLLLTFGASENTIGFASDYMKIYAAGTVFVQLTLGMNAFITAQGFARTGMLSVMIGAGCNIVLDPLLIYGFGMGIRGAAIATILAQIISLCWLIKIFCNKNELLHFRRGIYRLKGVLVENIIGIGLAPFFMNVASCMIVILINKGLKLYDGDLAIGAFGIVNRIVFLFVMIVMGLNQGMQPIAGYNFGARQFHRVNHVMKLTVIAATIVTSTGFLVGELIPELAVSAFTTDSKLIELSARGLRITVMFFPIIGFQMVTSNFFQSIGMASKAIFLSLTRQMLFLVPCLLILPHYYGQMGVWASMPVADLAASLISGGMLWWQFRQFKKVTV